jgi:hypothetical protein
VVGSGDDIDVVGVHEKDIRMNPQITGKKIANSIKKQLEHSQKTNKLLIEFMPGPIEPKILTSDFVKSISKKLPSGLVIKIRDFLITFATRYLNAGAGMEEDILHVMGEILDDYYIFGCSNFDDIKSLQNYQFYYTESLKGFVVALAIRTDNAIVVDKKLPLTPRGNRFKIERGWHNFCIDKIEGKPAAYEYVKRMGWPEDYIKIHVEQVFSKTFYHPLAFRDNEQIYPFPAGFFVKDTIPTNRKIRKDEVELFVTSARKTISNFGDFLKDLHNKSAKFTLIVEGMDIVGIFGGKINIMKKMLDEALGDSPYLVLFGSGEHSKKPNEKPIFCNYSMAMLSILGKE